MAAINFNINAIVGCSLRKLDANIIQNTSMLATAQLNEMDGKWFSSTSQWKSVEEIALCLR